MLAAGYRLPVDDSDGVGSGGCVADAVEAVPAQLQAFDVILLDIMMRRTNGVDVLVDLSRRFAGSVTPLPPVVAMTGNTSLQDMLTYQQAGFVHLLGKPFDGAALEHALSVCSSRRVRSTSGPTSVGVKAAV